MTELKIHSKTNLLYRENSGDLESIHDCLRNYKDLSLSNDDIVLDLGANIGGFSCLTAPYVKSIISIEANKSNFDVLLKNIQHQKRNNVLAIFSAVVKDTYEKDYIEFITTNSNISSLSGKVLYDGKKTRRNQNNTQIPALRFSKIVELYNPSILKIDVEGAEYGILEESIPSTIKQISGELHGMTNENHIKMFNTWKKLSSEWKVLFYKEKKMFNKTILIEFTITR